MNRRDFCTFLIAGSAFPAYASSGKTTSAGDLVDELTVWMGVAPVPGAWVGELKRNQVAWEHGFGVRNADTKQAVDATTIFEAASLTKQVTAYVAHAFRSAGILDFDKPLNDYVPDLSDAKAKLVTARHVLSHSSGFPNWRSQKGEALVPAFDPGSRFQYSGEGYVYLSRVLEKLADKPFAELVQERVFDPLGMASSSLIRLPERESRMATGHGQRGGVLESSGSRARRFWELAKESGKPLVSMRYPELEVALAKTTFPPLPNWMHPNAAASMCTTGRDYAKFVLEAMKNAELWKQQIQIGKGAGWELGWGLGWGIERAGKREYLWQWGDNSGYKNFVLLNPTEGSGIFVFTNGDAGMRICDRVVTHTTGLEHPAFLWV